MNDRTRHQLQIQVAVERLSIVVLSYYIVALLSYLFVGIKAAGFSGDPALETAVTMPVVVLLVAIVIRILHRKFTDPT
jgi:uncharacterized membrane-anchored protein